MNLGIIGISGKMGNILQQTIKKDIYLNLIGGVGKKNIEKDLFSLSKKSDILIDFSSPSSLKKLLTTAKKYKTPLIIGTTGYTKSQITQIKKSATEIPIFYSSNYSIGIAICKNLIKKATKLIKKNFSIEIKEKHHKEKKDSPSGTAISLKNEILKIKKNDLPITSLREGEIVGEHEVLFSNLEEEFSIFHKAKSRKAFANGVLLTIKFLYKKRKYPDLYSMENLFE
ncbi:MAG: hypothetical protein AMS24_04835 [Chlamydiae bacterium SM23_39]|nr:MAG: hypothetical protein AMS24_04835 [Chlamydiae bacterium SM23_39]